MPSSSPRADRRPGRGTRSAQHPWKRWAWRAVAALLLLLLADALLYPRLAPVGGQSGNRGENGLWLRYHWYFGRRGEAEARAMARRLAENQIRFAYFHVRHITRDGGLRYHYPEAARRLIAVMRREAPTVKVIAWIFAGNERLKHTGVGEVDLAHEAVRRQMVAEARWLVTTCGFDGVQWDYEIVDDGDPHLLALLTETRAALPPRAILSVATPIWSPLPGRFGFSETTFSRFAAVCDQIAVMGYDTGMALPRAYVWTMRQQAIHVTRAVAKGNARCRVIIGVPTYGKGPPSHVPWSENIRMALKGVREGLAHPDAAPAAFAGVAPFADYTTQPEEWETYRALWLDSSP